MDKYKILALSFDYTLTASAPLSCATATPLEEMKARSWTEPQLQAQLLPLQIAPDPYA